ncbi:MAG TPA: NAD-dependent epimerase/dehydratase family protein [Candidatus Sulfopaludibacter sp.]|jgi:nucleoside-diphosphate-sugar epimerase|nr:NAD-dependent epimerase/dehydratase family protein [Candidatus Sulfopaludibacter sp.]
MRVIVIGGSGHIGTYLTPRLVEAGYDVINVSRGQKQPYRAHQAWTRVTQIAIDRTAEEAAGTFGPRIAALAADVVIDITCYRPESARHLVESLRGKVAHFLHCGTIWVHGHSVQVPTLESAPRHPFGDYGCRKAAIEAYLLEEAQSGFPSTVLHPGHLVGPGWFPINPAGNFNPDVFSKLAAEEEVALPNLGMETLHHVYADDVAQAFVRAVQHRDAALGQSFHVVSAAALTLRGYAESMAAWYGRRPRLTFLPWEAWKTLVSEKDAAYTWDHIAHSPNCSIAKARQLLDYAPSYTSLQAVQESVSAFS